jgi:pimeloyl-ACP methyl ester carboxylesterase
MMETRYLEIEGAKIAYDDQGNGPLVICTPGMGDLRAEYRYLTPQLTAAGYRVVSMDVRGHGETDPEWPDYSVGAIGSDINALVGSLRAGPAVLVGTSMAAGAVVWAAAEAPDLVEGLVLIGPFVRGETSSLNKLLYAILFARPWGATVWSRYFPTFYPTRKPADFADYCAALRSNLAESGRLEALRAMMQASKSASEQRLDKVNVPGLVIMGSKDPDFKDPRGEAEQVAKSLNAGCEMVEGAGHYPHVEMPELTAPLILSFLKSLDGSRRWGRGS